MTRKTLTRGGAVLLALALGSAACARKPQSDYPIKPVAWTEVRFSGGFWAKRQEVNNRITILHDFEECEGTGRIKNFEIAGGMIQGSFCTSAGFDDSDVYKVVEAAGYALALNRDPTLEKIADGVIDKIAQAQEPDGYLYTARTIDPENPPRMSGKERWTNLVSSHELYNAGHLYEASVAYYQATGKKRLLDVALKNADLVVKTFGPGKDQLKFVPGHEEIEIGLVKLYRITGKKKYLDTARFFIDQRGNAEGHDLYGEYAQDHKPVVEQTEAVGHAVRAAYLYSGMADVAMLTGDSRYMKALDAIWEDVVSRKLYLTGGIGAAGSSEGFGPAYDLPNATGYAETCATIAYALWNWRMALCHGDGKYMDLFERAAYNAFLSGIGMSGDLFFYPNPLASFGRRDRTPWFSCACCPPNVARFIAGLGGFVYGVEEERIFVNLYVQGSADITTKAGKVTLEQRTDYPWNGDIRISVAPEKAVSLTLMVRIPGWAMGKPMPSDLYRYAEAIAEPPTVKVNGEPVALALEKGYVPIARTWHKGDTIEITLPMPVRRVLANAGIKADAGLVSVERGPLVYCAEWADNGGRVTNLVLDDESLLTVEERPDLLNGLTVITGEGSALRYEAGRLITEKRKMTLVPYYAWAHRGRGEMEVWIAREPGEARPLAEPTIASRAKVTASSGTGVEAVNDQFEPKNSGDDYAGWFYWRPREDSIEWLQYDFEKPVRVSEVQVYWSDDIDTDDDRLPLSWEILYKAGDKWQPVRNAGHYGVENDKYNVVVFNAVKTSALRLEVNLSGRKPSGIIEWKVK
ncbi:MAG: glycoside hydrolase family 127 protein [Candidatus Aminicenantales bacterium]